MTALVSLLFIAMIPIDCKITNFSYNICTQVLRHWLFSLKIVTINRSLGIALGGILILIFKTFLGEMCLAL